MERKDYIVLNLRVLFWHLQILGRDGYWPRVRLNRRINGLRWPFIKLCHWREYF
jgi:hypothetical protein